jgi:hypothetical protein
MSDDLAEVLDKVVARGFTHDFSCDGKSLWSKNTKEPLQLDELRIVESIQFDSGTDPGDDVTLFLIESTRGTNGYLMISDSFHTDPRKARFIDALLAKSSNH